MLCNNCSNCCPEEGGGGTVCCILSDQFCGDFDIDCGGTITVWTSDVPVVGTITVTYFGKGCADILTVDIFNGLTLVGHLDIPSPLTAQNGNARSITLTQQFDSLKITCGSGTGNACFGTYCLNIHYPSPFPLQ